MGNQGLWTITGEELRPANNHIVSLAEDPKVPVKISDNCSASFHLNSNLMIILNQNHECKPLLDDSRSSETVKNKCLFF